PDAVTWVRPREPWLLNRACWQPHVAAFERTVGGFACEMEAVAAAASVDDAFLRMGAGRSLRRRHRGVTPTMFRCPVPSRAEVEQFRRVRRVVRLARVLELRTDLAVLEHGVISADPGQVYVHCTADGAPRKPPGLVFEVDRITPQYVRRCSPVFAAALI